MAKIKSRTKNRAPKKIQQEKEVIVLDDQQGLIFENEKQIFAYFEKYIEKLEEEYQSVRIENDFSDSEQAKMEEHLEPTLEQPDQIWRDEKTFEDLMIFHFIRKWTDGKIDFYYVVTSLVSSEEEYPTFVFTHFPTKDPELLHNYQRGELVYDREVEKVQAGSIDGDALGEGDPLAVGLYRSMMKLRSDKDLPESEFKKYQELRDETIESADEIWRKTDMDGNILVTFIKDYPDHETPHLVYVVITQEEEQANLHSILYSFPTNDENLIDRYRQGENLQAEEVSQESSH